MRLYTLINIFPTLNKTIKLIPVSLKLVSTYSQMSLYNLKAVVKRKEMFPLVEKLEYLQTLSPVSASMALGKLITFKALGLLVYKTEELEQMNCKHSISFKILLLHKSLIPT